jgi:hypothetical protein
MPFGDVNVGGGMAQNVAGGLLGGIGMTTASMGQGMSGMAMINNVVVPPMTAVGIPFTLMVFFTNTSMQSLQFAGVINIQGLGIDMVTTSAIQVAPGQTGQVAQNLSVPSTLAGNALNYPGSVQIIHSNANGGQVLDDQTTFTIPAPTSVTMTVVGTTGVTVVPNMPISGSPSTVTPATMGDAVTGGTPTLPSVPGVGIVPMGSMTAKHPDWNPNDPKHMRHGHKTWNPMAMQWQDGMLVNGMWVPNMPKHTKSTTMMTDELGQTTTTTTEEMTTPGMMGTMTNPLMKNNMDLGARQMLGQPNRMGQMPINSAQNQVPAMPVPPNAPMGPGPMMWNNMPWNNNQQFMMGGVPWQMQRTGSFQFMPWMNPQTGMPGTFAMPMMQPAPMGFMAPGAMLAKDVENMPSIMDGEESTPFNDELDVMLLGRNRDRERDYDVPMPMLSGINDCVACGDNDSWAVIDIDDPDTGSGDDVPTTIRGYNFCPGERVKMSWHIVLYGMYDVEGQVFRGSDSVMCDHSGRFLYHPRFNELNDSISGSGLIAAHGTTSRKHANCTIGIS